MARRVLWIFAGAAAIRIAFALWAPGVPLADGRFYHLHATLLEQTGQYLNGDGSPAIRWMPGWPAVLALVYAVFGVSPRAGMVACGIFDAGTAALVAALGGRLFGRGAGTLAGALYALWPGMIYYAGTLFTEPLFNLLLVATLWLLEKGRPDAARPGVELLAGLCFGLACYVKSEPLALTPALLFAVWRLDPRPGPFARRGLALVGTTALLLAPWTLRNYVTFDRFIPTSASGGVVAQLANQPGATGGQDFRLQARLQREHRGANQAETTIRRNDVGYGEALRFVRDQPAEFAEVVARKLRLTYYGDVQGARTLRGTGRPAEWHVPRPVFRRLVDVANAWWTAALALAALGATTVLRWPRGAAALLLGPLASFFLLHVLFLGGQRFHAPEVPIYALLAARGLLLLARPLARLQPPETSSRST